MARILIVDDELKLRAAVGRLLSSRGYDVVTVASGEEALVTSRDRHFDAVILDLVLPGIGGTETLAALRKQSPDTAVVMLTAHSSVPSAVECFRAGACHYLTKPFDNEALCDVIDEVTRERPGALSVDRESRPAMGLSESADRRASVFHTMAACLEAVPARHLTRRRGLEPQLKRHLLHLYVGAASDTGVNLLQFAMLSHAMRSALAATRKQGRRRPSEMALRFRAAETGDSLAFNRVIAHTVQRLSAMGGNARLLHEDVLAQELDLDPSRFGEQLKSECGFDYRHLRRCQRVRPAVEPLVTGVAGSRPSRWTAAISFQPQSVQPGLSTRLGLNPEEIRRHGSGQ